MQIEYACYDRTLTEENVKQEVASAIQYGIKNLSIYQYSIPYIKPILTSDDIKISCPIDYPYGLSDLKTRNMMVSQLSKMGVNCIDLVMQSKFVANRKYDKIREDIKTNLDICAEHSIELRYILEYRIFSHEILAKICQILKNLNVHTVIPSTGQMIDDINDNIIAAKYLHTKSDINVVVNGNIWTQKHIDNIKNSNIKDIRLHYLSSVTLLHKNNIT
jgi:deoxyribose-phosphate aldolase